MLYAPPVLRTERLDPYGIRSHVRGDIAHLPAAIDKM
jgi:hypothetical protein